MNDDKNVFDQPINNNFETYESIRKIASGLGDDYTTGCLLDYMFFLISNSIFGFNIWNSTNNIFAVVFLTLEVAQQVNVTPLAIWLLVNKACIFGSKKIIK